MLARSLLLPGADSSLKTPPSCPVPGIHPIHPRAVVSFGHYFLERRGHLIDHRPEREETEYLRVPVHADSCAAGVVIYSDSNRHINGRDEVQRGRRGKGRIPHPSPGPYLPRSPHCV